MSNEDKKDVVIEDLDKVTTAVTDITATRQGIAKLKQKYGGVVFEVETTAGMDEAKKARAEIREPRWNIERLRKAAKRPVLDLGRSIDAIAAELTWEIRAIEDPIDAQIKKEEERVAEEKRKAEEADLNRQRQHLDKLEVMRDAINQVCSDPTMEPERVAHCLVVHKETRKPGEDWEEFQAEALELWERGIQKMTDHYNAMLKRVADEAQAEADRIELEKLREEKRLRDEADAKIELEKLREEKRKREEAEHIEEQQPDARPEPTHEDVGVDAEHPCNPEIKPVEEQLDRVAPVADVETQLSILAGPADPIEDTNDPDYPGYAAIATRLAADFDIEIDVAEAWIIKAAGELA